MTTRPLLKSSSINGFRSASKRILASTVLITVLFAGAGNLCHAITLGYLTDPFQAIEVNKTIQAAQQAGIKTLPVTNANGDAGKQVTDIHNLVCEGAQAILVMPADSEAPDIRIIEQPTYWENR